ncbi:right-handed parallel beta-helix repeat-containing protein [Sphaerisporangium perillae]|uniref:right-handed parallel beta-helix repeat-containing protein n=1 Tax=Sphaerisporangium perillae TaxID=2935860 RepID=UPI00200DF119|nr:right-handed parallel beta-helix repeat-containing protein [Sphaerisporangium perillae]
MPFSLPRRFTLLTVLLVLGGAAATGCGSGAADDGRDLTPGQTRQPEARPSPTSDGFPSAATTGLRPGVALKKVGEVTVLKPGAVVENLEVHGKLNIKADNVTVRNVRVIGEGDWSIIQAEGASGAVIENCEISGDGVVKAQWGVLNQGGDITVRRANIHTVSNSVGTDHGLIEDSYMHDFKEYPGDHVTGPQINGSPQKGLSLTIRHNTILNQISQTSAISIYQDFSRAHDVLIERNLLGGGGYTLYGGQGKFGTPTDIRVIGNVFTRRLFPKGGFWGPVTYFDAKGKGNRFEGNVWEGTGEPVSG